MFNRRDIVYLYDGSFDGLLCAIFECYNSHEIPVSIEENNNVQQGLFLEYKIISTDEKKARRVSNAVSSKISRISLINLYYAYLSDAENKEIACLEYVITGFHFGSSVNSRLAIDCVSQVRDAVKRVKNEAHQYLGFVRFRELEGGIFYSEINPKCNILPAISKHFQSRFSNMPWIIYDKSHALCLVYNGKSCCLTPVEYTPNIKLSEDELKYEHFWKTFYNTIEIKERHNERCRMTHMPKRFWENLIEMQEDKPCL